MMYQLNIMNHTTGEIEPVVYSTMENKMTLYGVDYLEQFSKLQLPPRGNRMKRVIIQLGFKCNFSCSHCHQAGGEKKKYTEEQVEDAIDFLFDKTTDNTLIEFWGGEPLLYLSYIKKILGQAGRGVPKKIITNGSLLTLENAKWLIENNFMVHISHDAQAQYKRGNEILDNPTVKEAVLWLLENHNEKIKLLSVTHPDNIIIGTRINYYAEKLGIPKEALMDNIDGAGPLTNMIINPLNVIPNITETLYADMRNGSGYLYGYNRNVVEDTMYNLMNPRLYLGDDLVCGAGTDTNLYEIHAMDGSKLTCHNYEGEHEILPHNDKCKNCALIRICSGGCPLIDNTKGAGKETCDVKFKFHLAHLKMAIYILSHQTRELVSMEKIQDVYM